MSVNEHNERIEDSVCHDVCEINIEDQPESQDSSRVTVPERLKCGETLFNDALEIINGGRQDEYGNPEDSFWEIAVRWNQYLSGRHKLKDGAHISSKDVALMMADFKLARECHQHKRDNIVDCVGYLGISDSI